jgi:hypothetical protein
MEEREGQGCLHYACGQSVNAEISVRTSIETLWRVQPSSSSFAEIFVSRLATRPVWVLKSGQWFATQIEIAFAEAGW